ncbi:terminase small subunit [Entomomonas moraniae]|uniref:Terminase small subunit n=1 Tax=Entomomonas moraniae TaxID=2213226 RepID=A0A3S9XDB7_9GAMM|nr:terminase small subunit [Entomomonas moraniae]AZS50407.1 terminase small subunit [Entomomonas moraniae]
MRKLTNKQKLFVKEYLIDLNASQAAIRAGYSKASANQIATELLGKTVVINAIQKAMDKRTERTKINADYVLNRLVEIDQLDVADILQDDGKLKPIQEWPKAWRQSITGIDVQELMSGDIESLVKKIKWPDKLKNLELLGKHVAISAFNEKQEQPQELPIGKIQVEVVGANIKPKDDEGTSGVLSVTG